MINTKRERLIISRIIRNIKIIKIAKIIAIAIIIQQTLIAIIAVKRFTRLKYNLKPTKRKKLIWK